MESCRLFHGIWKYFTPTVYGTSCPNMCDNKNNVMLAALLFGNAHVNRI